MFNNLNVWDLPEYNFNSGTVPGTVNNTNFRRAPTYGNGTVLSTGNRMTNMAPPVPPRPVQNNWSYNSMGSPFNSFGYGGYSRYGGSSYGFGYRPNYSSYGYGYGSGTGRYGEDNLVSRFLQHAEESSRPAMETIHSVLEAFNSVAMMFGTMFDALNSSYMSILGVAHNFGMMRNVFQKMFSVLAIFRIFPSIFRRILYLIGVSSTDANTNMSWKDALNSTKGEKSKQQTGISKMWLKFVITLAIPIGLYKLCKMLGLIPKSIQESWNPANNPGSLAVGMYDFHSSNPEELNFGANQKLMIAPETFQPTNCPGWVLACNGNKKVGLIPHNYIGMVMQSEKTGRTYVEHNGQKYEPANSIRDEDNTHSNETNGNSAGTSMEQESEITAETASGDE